METNKVMCVFILTTSPGTFGLEATQFQRNLDGKTSIFGRQRFVGNLLFVM
jgi:hypothetical protein